MFELILYTEDDGSRPVEQFLDGLLPKLRAKVLSDMERLRTAGNTLREPQSKHLEDGIFELRTVQGNNIVRILFFYDRGRIVVLTNGFVKKQQRAPRREIELAIRRREQYWKNTRR